MMVEYLVLLTLTEEHTLYNREGLLRTLCERIGEEVPLPDQKDFDLLLLDMADQGLIDIQNHGTPMLTVSGRSKLRQSKFVFWICGLAQAAFPERLASVTPA